jgi:hypothetical protein
VRWFLPLPLLPQSVAIELSQRTTDLPESRPRLPRAASDFGMLRRDVQRTALAILSIRNVEVRAMQVFGIAATDAVGIAAAAGGLRQAALDHRFGCSQEALKEPLFLTHSLILRYGYLVWQSRGK